MPKKRKSDLSLKRVETALPYHQFTRDILTQFVRHKLNASTICVYHYLSLNQDINRGKTHRLKIEDIAEDLDMAPATVYRCIARLKEVGLFSPTDWGTIIGTLPYAQLAKHTATQAKHEKREKAFYKEIMDRIKQWEGEEGTLVTPTQAQHYFVEVYRERKESQKYFPKDPEAQRNLYEKLEYYFPNYKDSELYPGIEV